MIDLIFEKKTYFSSDPLYLVRSVLGMNLHRLCCSFENTDCLNCLINKHCLYSRFFEGITEKNVEKELDETKKSLTVKDVSPFSLHLESSGGREHSDLKYSFRMVLYGKHVYDASHIVGALKNAGKGGLGSAHTKFSLATSDIIDTKEWDEKREFNQYSGRLLLNTLTPLRFKYNGKYGTDFSSKDFFLALRRRYIKMIELFGDFPAVKNDVSEEERIARRNLRWQDFEHYSARQKTQMKLGGAVGTVVLEGDFSAYEMMLLDFASMFSAGKNTSFGLGNIEFWKPF